MGSNLTTSAGRLFQFFRSGEVSTRRELMELTDLARSTIGMRVDQLIASGLVREHGTATSSGGRPATILAFDDETPTILAADLGATHGRVAVTDAGGRIHAEKVILSQIAGGPETVLKRVCDEFDQLLGRASRTPQSVCGIGIGVPGPVDFANARVVRAPLMPGWQDHAIRDTVSQRFEASTHVDNDANLMALGEQRRAHAGAHALVFVKVGTGIGAGVVIDGLPLRGSHGAEGDIGHVRLAGSKQVCACGASGCLAASASGGAVVRSLAEDGLEVTSVADVITQLDAGDLAAIDAVTRAGRRLSDVLAAVVALVNPDVLVLGGELGSTEHLLRGVHERLLQRTQPLATQHLVVTATALRERAGVAGIVEMVREQEFNAAAVDAQIAAMT